MVALDVSIARSWLIQTNSRLALYVYWTCTTFAVSPIPLYSPSSSPDFVSSASNSSLSDLASCLYMRKETSALAIVGADTILVIRFARYFFNACTIKKFYLLFETCSQRTFVVSLFMTTVGLLLHLLLIHTIELTHCAPRSRQRLWFIARGLLLLLTFSRNIIGELVEIAVMKRFGQAQHTLKMYRMSYRHERFVVWCFLFDPLSRGKKEEGEWRKRRHLLVHQGRVLHVHNNITHPFKGQQFVDLVASSL